MACAKREATVPIRRIKGLWYNFGCGRPYSLALASCPCPCLYTCPCLCIYPCTSFAFTQTLPLALALATALAIALAIARSAPHIESKRADEDEQCLITFSTQICEIRKRLTAMSDCSSLLKRICDLDSLAHHIRRRCKSPLKYITLKSRRIDSLPRV